MDYLQNDYNIFRRLLKTLLYYCVKHESLYYFTYLFTALSNSACTNHEFTKLRNCWTFGWFGTAFNRVQLTAQLMEGAPSHLCTGGRRTFWALAIC